MTQPVDTTSADRQRAYNQRKRNKLFAKKLENVTLQIETRPMIERKPKEERWGDERYTPHVWIERARSVLGAIDLDPASCAYVQQRIGAAVWYGVDHPLLSHTNALCRPWAGRVWMNPPYSDPLPFVERLLAFYRAGEVTQAIVLLNLASSPAWAQLLKRGGYPVCLLDDRIQFELGPDATDDDRRRNNNDRDQFVWYLGPKRARFAAVFRPYGDIR